MRKFRGVMVAWVLLLLSGCAAGSGDGVIRIWVAENTVDFTRQQVAAFLQSQPQFAGFSVVVEPVGEGDAANHMLTDVESGADLYVFAQDQLARLVAANALVEVAPQHIEALRRSSDPGAVQAVTLGGQPYAYPMTADNGYFLYYDRSVVSDPGDLASILRDCEAAGRGFYFDVTSGWYQPAFFFGAGATLTYEADAAGNMTAMRCTYASTEGVRALRAMINMVRSPAFVNGASASQATNMAAMVGGVWDQATVQAMLGDNYAAAPLPMAEGFQLGGFSGYKLLGVNPQTDPAKLAACDALAAWLTSGEVQLARYLEPSIQWGPADVAAQAHPQVQANAALTALRAQRAHCVVQGQYPNEYWTLAAALGGDILAHRYDHASDEELLRVLTTFQTTAGSYVTGH